MSRTIVLFPVEQHALIHVSYLAESFLASAYYLAIKLQEGIPFSFAITYVLEMRNVMISKDVIVENDNFGMLE